MDFHEKRDRIRKIVIILILLNLSLFLIKWIPTLIFPSISVEADAFNSLGDFGYSLLFLLGFEVLLRPKDESHPHGHERFEPFISLMVAAAIGSTGVLVVRNAIMNFSESAYSFSPFLIIALLISVGTKYWLYFFLKKEGKRIKSSALISSSEDSKADVLASLAALIGVIGAWGGFLFLDTIFGLIVSIWIFKTALHIGKKNIEFLTGATAPKKIIKQIENILKTQDKISSYHNLEAHYVGPEIHVSISIHLPKKLDFDKVHETEEEIKQKIGSIENVDAVYLHLEPKDRPNSSEN